MLEIDGRKLPQIPGSIFLVAPGVPHEYYPQQGMWETAWVVFRGACIRELMTNLGFGNWNERSGAELSGMRWDLCKAAFRSVRPAERR